MLKRLGSNTIDRYYSNNPRYGGWWNKDKLPPVIDSKFYIVNMEDHGGNGTHWVMIYNCRKNGCIYYDSFGIHPPSDIVKFIKTSGKRAFMSDVEMQNIKSESCGWYCMKVIDYLEKGLKFSDILLDKFSFDTIDNEKVLKGGGAFKIGKKIKNIKKGFISRVSEFIKGPRLNAPPAIRKMMRKQGDKEIVSITVCRTPVSSIVQKALNLVSLGTWEKAKARIDHDDFYHLFLFFSYADGSTYRIEKNEVVVVTKTNKKEGACINVNMNGRKIKTKDFIENAEKENPLTFWLYSSKNNNCQVFVSDVLKYNGLLTPEVETFVKQKTIKLFEQMPQYVETIANIATDLGARADILISGKGVYNSVYWEFKKPKRTF